MLSTPLVTTVLSLLYLLESANVELRPAAVYGKAARRAAAAGQTPASVIHIHSPAPLPISSRHGRSAGRCRRSPVLSSLPMAPITSTSSSSSSEPSRERLAAGMAAAER
jgi:hypothetical protein